LDDADQRAAERARRRAIRLLERDGYRVCPPRERRFSKQMSWVAFLAYTAVQKSR